MVTHIDFVWFLLYDGISFFVGYSFNAEGNHVQQKWNYLTQN